MGEWENGKMLKLEDFDPFFVDMIKAFSEEGSVIAELFDGGSAAIIPKIKKDDPRLKSTENGLVLSEEGLKDMGAGDYLFIPQGFYSKDKKRSEG